MWSLFRLWTPVLVCLAIEEPFPATIGGLKAFPPKTKYFSATLDHFRFSGPNAPGNGSFEQKYLVYDEFWSPKGSGPILIYFGNEGNIEDFYNNTGLLFELAPKLGAMVVFLEHRYYGTSLPFGQSSYHLQNLYLLTIEQALGDMALFISSKGSVFGCTGTYTACPVVLFGGSYGGMLSAWFQVKYPHLAAGAIAASAPVDIYPKEGKSSLFFEATMHTYKRYGSEKCEKNLRKTVEFLQNISISELQTVSEVFQTCSPIGKFA
ncbi:hypothetical protein AAMO2058_001558200 [Amorphochlora amoebiformis]